MAKGEHVELTVARLRAAEIQLNEAIRDAARAGLVVEITTLEVSVMLDRSAQPIVSLRIMKEL